MKGSVTIVLAIALMALAFHYTSTTREPPVRLLLSTEMPIVEIDRCIQIYGKQAIKGLVRTGAGRGLDGGARIVGPPGATYLGEGGTRVTLLPRSNLTELKVRASSSLRPEQVAIFRRCVARPG